MMVSAAPTEPPPSNTTVATKPKIWREIWLPAASVVMSDADKAGVNIEPGMADPLLTSLVPASSAAFVFT